jgi:acyl-CoA thioesterase YciA
MNDSLHCCSGCPSIRIIMMPKDTNSMGTIFGGVILSYIDLAAASEARRFASRRWVTKAMHEVEFVAPVHLGDAVCFYSKILRVGRTSLTVRVDVEAERFRENQPAEMVKVTEAEVVLVATDAEGRPIPIHADVAAI